MFKSIQPTLNEIEVVYAQERTLFSHHLKTAGRVDCVGKFRGKTHIIDFKTSNKPKNGNGLTIILCKVQHIQLCGKK